MVKKTTSRFAKSISHQVCLLCPSLITRKRERTHRESLCDLAFFTWFHAMIFSYDIEPWNVIPRL